MAKGIENELDKIVRPNTVVKEMIYLNNYIVYEDGNIYSLITKKFLKPQNGGGYKQVYLKGKGGNQYLHRIVAECFIPNPENKPYINHKDGNKYNNHADNLEWVCASENIKHAYNNDLNKHPNQVIQLTLNDEFVAIYQSAAEANRCTGINRMHINGVCRQERKTAGGFKWKLTA